MAHQLLGGQRIWGWVYLAGIFSTELAMAACSDGSLYIVGRDYSSSLWSYHYVPGGSSSVWRFRGGLTQGNPSVACGTDNAAYVAVRDNYQSHWVARVLGDTWTGWFYRGAVMQNHAPQIAALGNWLLSRLHPGCWRRYLAERVFRRDGLGPALVVPGWRRLARFLAGGVARPRLSRPARPGRQPLLVVASGWLHLRRQHRPVLRRTFGGPKIGRSVVAKARLPSAALISQFRSSLCWQQGL